MEDKMDQTNEAIKNKLKTVQSEAERESLSSVCERDWRGNGAPVMKPGTVWDDQLPEGWVAPLRGRLSSVLSFDVVVAAAAALDGAETAGVVEEELTPLEVLTELCWMASLWGLPGTDISSQLSSLSETVSEKKRKKQL